MIIKENSTLGEGGKWINVYECEHCGARARQAWRIKICEDVHIFDYLVVKAIIGNRKPQRKEIEEHHMEEAIAGVI